MKFIIPIFFALFLLKQVSTPVVYPLQVELLLRFLDAVQFSAGAALAWAALRLVKGSHHNEG